MAQLTPDAVGDFSTVALDTVVFAYFLGRHETHYQSAKRLLGRIEKGSVSGVISALAIAELLVPAYRAGDEQRAVALTKLLESFPNLEIVPVTPEISADAACLRTRYGLRTADAIQVATAFAASAAGIVTDYRGFRRLQPEMRVWLFAPKA